MVRYCGLLTCPTWAHREPHTFVCTVPRLYMTRPTQVHRKTHICALYHTLVHYSTLVCCTHTCALYHTLVHHTHTCALYPHVFAVPTLHCCLPVILPAAILRIAAAVTNVPMLVSQ